MVSARTSATASSWISEAMPPVYPGRRLAKPGLGGRPAPDPFGAAPVLDVPDDPGAVAGSPGQVRPALEPARHAGLPVAGLALWRRDLRADGDETGLLE